jgi:hypothetical protein
MKYQLTPEEIVKFRDEIVFPLNITEEQKKVFVTGSEILRKITFKKELTDEEIDFVNKIIHTHMSEGKEQPKKVETTSLRGGDKFSHHSSTSNEPAKAENALSESEEEEPDYGKAIPSYDIQKLKLNKPGGKMTDEYNVDELVEHELEEIDLKPYEGQKVKIAKIEIVPIFSKFTNKEEPTLKVITEPVATVDTASGPIELTATELFSLVMKDGKLGWSASKKAKIRKLFKRLSVSTPKELIDHEVTIIIRPVGDRNYLGFAV